MKGALVRVGIDQAYGKWNAPINPDTNDYVYVPIPENEITEFNDGLETQYQQIIPNLVSFCVSHQVDLHKDLNFPLFPTDKMHLDPDFNFLTYGDNGVRRGSRIAKMEQGDFIVFYGSFQSINKLQKNLVYALMGIYFIDEIVWTKYTSKKRYKENAHTRKKEQSQNDIIVRALPDVSGRFKKTIPIGEYRANAYRVKNNLLDEWGGLTVKNGFIQRSAVPPFFLSPTKFITWLFDHDISLIDSNG